MDVFTKCTEFVEAVRRPLVEADVYPYYRVISSAQEPVVVHEGQELVMLGSNNYLGLTNHPEVKEASAMALALYGTGCAGSRLLNGTLDVHVQLERKLAEFTGREAAITFATGFQANIGAISCLLDRSDVAILDALNHASIIDGTRLGFARSSKFRHNDMGDLDKKLAAAPPDKGKLIIVDGVFSMEGDLAPLPEIVALKERHGARLMVDDAHGLGVFGENGRGTPEHFEVEGGVDLVMGTFSKSLATVGGFVAGATDVVEYIMHSARAEIFSAAPPPACAAAALKAIEIVEREPERRKQLWENTEFMQQELRGLGFDTGDAASPVIPIVIGGDIEAFTFAMRLQDEGVFANPVVTPAVPPGRSMIRTSYMATHSREQLERALEAFEKVGRDRGVIGG